VLPQVVQMAVQKVALMVQTLAVQPVLPQVVQPVLNLVGWTVALLAAQKAVLQVALQVVRQSYPRKHRLDGYLSLVQSGPHLPCQRRSPIEGSHFNQLAKWVARQSDS